MRILGRGSLAGSLHVATLPRILNGSLAGSLEVATPLKNPSKGSVEEVLLLAQDP